MLRHPILLLPVLLIVLLVSIVITACIGVSGLSLLTFDSDMIHKLIFEVRLPRIIGALLVGGGLAAAGCVMQGLFRNPMADPYIIGTSTGGALGAASAIFFLGGILMPLFAFIGAAASTITVYLISKRNGRMAVETLLLSGLAVSLFLSAMLSFIMYMSGNNLHQIMFWMMGGFWNMYWDDVGLALLIPVAAVILYIFSRDLNVMALAVFIEGLDAESYDSRTPNPGDAAVDPGSVYSPKISGLRICASCSRASTILGPPLSKVSESMT